MFFVLYLCIAKAVGKDVQTWYRTEKASMPEELAMPMEECYIRSDLLVKKQCTISYPIMHTAV